MFTIAVLSMAISQLHVFQRRCQKKKACGINMAQEIITLLKKGVPPGE